MDNDLYIQSLIDEAIEILSPMKIYYTTKAGNNTRALVKVVKELYPLLKDEYPVISNILESVTRNLIRDNGCINAYSFGDLRTSLHTLDMLYSNPSAYKHIRRKVFISHSSKDKDIVSEFCDRILRLGIGLGVEDIFCTSIEDMNIKNGDDIRKHIKENILSADFSFLLISENYKKSEICLNEMGAVWATDNNVRYYLLPNIGFDKIGWLCDTNQAEHLIDHIALDKLYYELTHYYNLDVKLESWSRQRMNFINNVTKNHRENSPATDAIYRSSKDRIYSLIKSTPNLTLSEIATLSKLSRETVIRCLRQLQDSNKIEAIRTAGYVRWKIIA